VRTVYQTISLSDRLDLAFTPQRSTEIALRGNVDIPDNLVTKAARLCLDQLRLTGKLEMRLDKKIPMGAGLGGGSSDAAAVLLALPVLAGGEIPVQRLIGIGRELGSDVPFFLLGGRAVGAGRGTELYPLTDLAARSGVVVTPPIHVSTAAAYRGLGRVELTTELLRNSMDSFLGYVWSADLSKGINDFEESVFREHPPIRTLKRKLAALGADPAMMSGSGSSLFGFFESRTQLARVVTSFRKEKVFPISLVGRSRYQALWRRWLEPHRIQSKWPLRSQYAR